MFDEITKRIKRYFLLLQFKETSNNIGSYIYENPSNRMILHTIVHIYPEKIIFSHQKYPEKDYTSTMIFRRMFEQIVIDYIEKDPRTRLRIITGTLKIEKSYSKLNKERFKDQFTFKTHLKNQRRIKGGIFHLTFVLSIFFLSLYLLMYNQPIVTIPFFILSATFISVSIDPYRWARNKIIYRKYNDHL